jgi:glycolate oxidase FAD binding subunit
VRYVRAQAPPSDAAKVRAARIAPAAVEVDGPSGELAVMIEGTPDGVRTRAGLLAKLLSGEITETPPVWWGADPWPPDGIGVKLSVPLSKVPDLVAGGGVVRGSAGTGVLYAAAGDITEVELLRARCVRLGGHAVVLTAPPPVRDILDMWGPVAGLALMRRVKDQFDPEHRFAPGRFVGGI